MATINRLRPSGWQIGSLQIGSAMVPSRKHSNGRESSRETAAWPIDPSG